MLVVKYSSSNLGTEGTDVDVVVPSSRDTVVRSRRERFRVRYFGRLGPPKCSFYVLEQSRSSLYCMC